MAAPSTRVPQTSLAKRIGRDAPLGYALLIPLMLVAFGLLMYPIANAFGISLQDRMLGVQGPFIGLGNYIELLTDDRRFRTVVTNSLVFTLASVTGKIIFGMVMALILNQRIRFRGMFRGWLLFPWVAPTFVTALTWRWMYDGTAGVINYVLLNLKLIDVPIAWLAESATALGAVVATNIWRGFPFFGVALLAAMQAIPADLYEAADVDGATALQKFLNVTLPGIRTTLAVTAMLSTIWTFNDFQIVFLMTGGGPAYATHLFATYAYKVGFEGSRIGYATAISFLLAPVLIVMIMALSPLIMRSENE
ncbi:MAG TPA: sugar ABC transporter permease [Thermoflexales bacterium]|nr:sugar ABC transporter permease [Thermoflexales bacterium]HQX10042.1 sugar ABC transporter permease [Thermoflexales bacterium]HQZ55154.1 sugar ABC transporter permease [Thermoflexales bacterium]HRA53339.1 sugar ABC transporter permease [Thermoflexales bacterium]